MDVLAGPGHVVGRRGRRALTVDARSLALNRRRLQKPARHRSRSENENFAQTDATSEPGIPKPTSGHLRRRRRARCAEIVSGLEHRTTIGVQAITFCTQFKTTASTRHARGPNRKTSPRKEATNSSRQQMVYRSEQISIGHAIMLDPLVA